LILIKSLPEVWVEKGMLGQCNSWELF
jgi:hypothetical protein